MRQRRLLPLIGRVEMTRHGALALVMGITIVASIGFMATPMPANAFGTIHGMGQDAEHERITRAALGCTSDGNPDLCLEDETLEAVAGTDGEFGAVGAPDRGRMVFQTSAHCDSADYFDMPSYPQSREAAQMKLEECRDWMHSNMLAAVEAAASLLDEDGEIRDSQIPTWIDCVFAGSVPGRAKCNVLQHFGIVLHAAQDFYSHSNWVDRQEPDRPLALNNPPGLDHSGPAAWLDLREEQATFPNGLISGSAGISSCFDNGGLLSGESCITQSEEDEEPRVTHADLNKDTGRIRHRGRDVGSGTTPRGAVEENFERAVAAAIADTLDKLATLNELLIERYGETRGRTMICAITRDDPEDDCP